MWLSKKAKKLWNVNTNLKTNYHLYIKEQLFSAKYYICKNHPFVTPLIIEKIKTKVSSFLKKVAPENRLFLLALKLVLRTRIQIINKM